MDEQRGNCTWKVELSGNSGFKVETRNDLDVLLAIIIAQKSDQASIHLEHLILLYLKAIIWSLLCEYNAV